LLDNITLYWLTNTATSAARLYWEAGTGSVIVAAREGEISLPVAITVFPGTSIVPGDGPAPIT
jgi:hypothetical protein